MLGKGQHLKACLNVLLGISEFYRFESSLQDKNNFLTVLPYPFSSSRGSYPVFWG
jgi:hypothetical protein